MDTKQCKVASGSVATVLRVCNLWNETLHSAAGKLRDKLIE